MDAKFIELPRNAIDITGQRFGRWVAIGPVGRNQKGDAVTWLCRCDCGNEATVIGWMLRNGNTKSCGCFHKDRVRELNTTHGMTGTTLHKNWIAMNGRCNHPGNANYEYYGGRGIVVCEEWQQSFQAFYEHVIQLPHCGEPGYYLDRIDNNGNYTPGNVRWATMSEQLRNTRRTHLITYHGETRCVTEWAALLGMRPQVLFHRLRRGWDIERALTRPVTKSSKVP